MPENHDPLAWLVQHATILGLFGADQGANDCAVGAPDGVEAARAIFLQPDEGAWDVELLLSVKGAAMGPPAMRPDDQGQHAENTVASRRSIANRASSRRTWINNCDIRKYCQTHWMSRLSRNRY